MIISLRMIVIMNEKSIEYQGRKYTLNGDYWIDESYMIAPSSIQMELNQICFSEEILNETDIDILVETGDRYKKSSSISLAIKCYRRAIEIAEANENISKLQSILARLTSCLRDQGKPEEVVSLFASIKKRFNSKIFNSALLTSAAAAYCDLQEYENAKKCCDRAYALSGGKVSGELRSVYGRIKKEYGEF